MKLRVIIVICLICMLTACNDREGEALQIRGLGHEAVEGVVTNYRYLGNTLDFVVSIEGKELPIQISGLPVLTNELPRDFGQVHFFGYADDDPAGRRLYTEFSKDENPFFCIYKGFPYNSKVPFFDYEAKISINSNRDFLLILTGLVNDETVIIESITPERPLGFSLSGNPLSIYFYPVRENSCDFLLVKK